MKIRIFIHLLSSLYQANIKRVMYGYMYILTFSYPMKCFLWTYDTFEDNFVCIKSYTLKLF